MFRLLFRLIILLAIFAIIRYLVATITRTISRATGARTPSAPRQQTGASAGGELKQDPVCGTFVPISTSVTKTVNGELLHFCSAACRDKFKVA
jgi:YHS domain-containing protein